VAETEPRVGDGLRQDFGGGGGRYREGRARDTGAGARLAKKGAYAIRSETEYGWQLIERDR
jgi:hypothetical protein